MRWTGVAYHVYIALIPDLIFLPMFKGMFDRKMSREQELEADIQSLYLLKRSGYDPKSILTTLALLPEDRSTSLFSKTKEMIADHPNINTRLAHLQNYFTHSL